MCSGDPFRQLGIVTWGSHGMEGYDNIIYSNTVSLIQTHHPGACLPRLTSSRFDQVDDWSTGHEELVSIGRVIRYSTLRGRLVNIDSCVRVAGCAPRFGANLNWTPGVRFVVGRIGFTAFDPSPILEIVTVVHLHLEISVNFKMEMETSISSADPPTS